MLSFNRTLQFPFKYKVPIYINAYLQKVGFYKRFFKYFKRYLYVLIKRQKKCEIFLINPNHKKILWINISAPSLGDSLMDLSSREMLKGKKVDLFTDIKNCHLYMDDQFFNNVYTKFSEVKSVTYDLVIIDSFSTRSIKVKSKIAPKTKYVGMFGYFNGPEVNRVLFSFHQLNHLLGYIKTESEINNLAKSSISISKSDQALVKKIIPKDYIVIVLGGEWGYKTFKNWGKLIEQITQDDSEIKIVLVGSKNALTLTGNLLNQFSKNIFLNLVDKLTFNQTAEVIRQSKIVFCCDGGLMHAANATGANIVSLFARLTPEILLTKKSISHNLFDKEDVNNIPVQEIFQKYYENKKNIYY